LVVALPVAPPAVVAAACSPKMTLPVLYFLVVVVAAVVVVAVPVPVAVVVW